MSCLLPRLLQMDLNRDCLSNSRFWSCRWPSCWGPRNQEWLASGCFWSATERKAPAVSRLLGWAPSWCFSYSVPRWLRFWPVDWRSYCGRLQKLASAKWPLFATMLAAHLKWFLPRWVCTTLWGLSAGAPWIARSWASSAGRASYHARIPLLRRSESILILFSGGMVRSKMYDRLRWTGWPCCDLGIRNLQRADYHHSRAPSVALVTSCPLNFQASCGSAPAMDQNIRWLFSMRRNAFE